MISPTQKLDWNGTRIAWRTIGNHMLYFRVFPDMGDPRNGKAKDVSLGIQNTALAAMPAFWQLARPKIIAHDFGGATT